MTDREFCSLILPEEAAEAKKLFQQLTSGPRQAFQLESPIRRKDGRLSWGRLTVTPLRCHDRSGQFAIGILEDISGRKSAEARMQDYQEKLRAVALELSLTEERERRRLAGDLHDHVGQILALAQLKLTAMRGLVSARLTASVDEIRRLLEQSIAYTRSMTLELGPPILYDLGFAAAVEWLGEILQEQYAIRLKVASDRTLKPLADEMRDLLFHLVRELLLIVVKRAKPNHITVLISRHGKYMSVKIDNDGARLDLGGDPLQLTPDALGLFSIRERLHYLGGHLEVKSPPNQSTLLSLTVPLKY